jgi:methylenetetrahydrofolate reductase (NADPH)
VVYPPEIIVRDPARRLKGKDIRSIYDWYRSGLMEFKPSFINVTYHREEVIYKERGHRSPAEECARGKRPGPWASVP